MKLTVRWPLPYVSRAKFDAVAESALAASMEARQSASCLLEASEQLQNLQIELRNIKEALRRCRAELKSAKGKR